MGGSRNLLEGGHLFRFNLTRDRKAIDVDDPRLDDGVADNLHKWEITESESLLFGRNFGVGTDIQTGPDGDLYVVSSSLGSVLEIFRPEGARPPLIAAATVSGRSSCTAWPAPGTTSTRQSAIAVAIRPAIARNFASRSPTTSVTGIASSPSRSHSGGITPVPSPRSAAARPAAVLRSRSACAAAATRSGWPANSACAPHSSANASTPIASIRSASASSARRRASRSAASASPGLAPTSTSRSTCAGQRERGVERDPAAHRVAHERARLVCERADVGGAGGERCRAGARRPCPWPGRSGVSAR